MAVLLKRFKKTDAEKVAKIKTQRDRFLAFAFASSDLFVEISKSGKVTYALGASKTLSGIDDETLLGMDWL